MERVFPHEMVEEGIIGGIVHSKQKRQSAFLNDAPMLDLFDPIQRINCKCCSKAFFRDCCAGS